MPYTPQTWTDGSTATPLSAARLGVIETGIQTAQATAEAAQTQNALTTSAVAEPVRSATTTRTTITASAVTAKTVFLKADSANTSVVYIGDSTVTSTGGGNVFAQLLAGDGVSLDVASTSGIYVVAASGTQKIYVGVMV